MIVHRPVEERLSCIILSLLYTGNKSLFPRHLAAKGQYCRRRAILQHIYLKTRIKGYLALSKKQNKGSKKSEISTPRQGREKQFFHSPEKL